MGGRLSVESVPDQGATFSFTANLRVFDQPLEKPAVRPVSLEGLPVLVVDDNQTNLTILREMLARWRMNPSAVADGATALAALSGSPHGFPLVLLDAMMPGIDGFAVARQIRQDPRLDAATIMMLSSADRPGDAEQCRALGVAAYLQKPIKQSELLDAIVLALSKSGVGSALPDNRAEVSVMIPKGLVVLLAEDNEVNQELAIAILERRGCHVVLARNGREAVALWEREKFDVVLMDVQMPEMDGLSATRNIRQLEKTRGVHTPIVALTAHVLEGRQGAVPRSRNGRLREQAIERRRAVPGDRRRAAAARAGAELRGAGRNWRHASSRRWRSRAAGEDRDEVSGAVSGAPDRDPPRHHGWECHRSLDRGAHARRLPGRARGATGL
jgi:CheY-like chemotaxis protein